MLYADLNMRLAAALGDDHSTDTDWATYLPALIEQAELRCYRDVDFLCVRAKVGAVLTPGLATFATPTDWVFGQGVRLTDENLPLDRRDDTFLDEYGGVGRPRYWSEPVAGTLRVAPVPTIPFAAEITYHARPAALTAANPSTWLSLNAPDLLFHACMVVATGYIRNFGAQADDPKMAVSWEAQYQVTLTGVRREESRRKGDNAFDSSAAPPSPRNTP